MSTPQRALLLLFLALAGTLATAQQPSPRIGSVALQDATVAGALDVTSGQAVLVGTSTVTARDRVAELKLDRGGVVRVCQTSGLHIAAGSGQSANPPLMLALDRGAIEVAMPALGSDVILTPDLRFTIRGIGPLDLRLRVVQNGDTCVEQRGKSAPTLTITDSFGEASYELHAGQHVLFEHGSLREVVDHETSPCGCPPATMSLAEAALASRSAEPASQHPFPAAQSAGLAPEPAIPQAAVGTDHTQLAATLTFPPAEPSSANPPPPPIQPTTPPVYTQPPHGFAHALGHFFRRIFGGA